MTRKIGRVRISTIDDKNHVHYWTENDIELDSIKFKIDAKKEKTQPETVKEPPKETKKEPKKDSKKK